MLCLDKIDVWLFLDTFETFEECVLPFYNDVCKRNGKQPITNDEAINLFLELRKDYNIDANKN